MSRRERIGRVGKRIAKSQTARSILRQARYYFISPMVDDEGNEAMFFDEMSGRLVPRQVAAYIMHFLKTCVSELFFRIVMSIVFVLVSAGFNSGFLNLTLAAVAKGAVMGGGLAIMGYHSCYGRWENVVASWFPSSSRMLTPGKHIVPYADLIHVAGFSAMYYVGSLIGGAIALWVSSFGTLNDGLPSTISITWGMLGGYSVTTSDIWILETFGSAVITFIWLMLVVDEAGAKDRVTAGVAYFLGVTAIASFTFSATGANFDFLHFGAIQTILANQNHTGRHKSAYIFSTIIGVPIAVLLWLVIDILDAATRGTNPGIPQSVVEAEDFSFRNRRRTLERGSDILFSRGNISEGGRRKNRMD